MSAYPNLVWAPFLADHLLKSLGVFEVRPLLLYPGLSCHSKPGMDKLGWHPAWGGALSKGRRPALPTAKGKGEEGGRGHLWGPENHQRKESSSQPLT